VPAFGNLFSEGGSASLQLDPLPGNGKVFNPYRKESSRKEREGEKEEGKLEWSVSVEEDSEMEEDAGTILENANEGRERTADSTENNETDGSPERG
jgi:hypothetical protein